MYTEQQISEWKEKARKWDDLDKRIGKCYFVETEDGEFEENTDDNVDLGTIGEIAAGAFGYL